MTLDYKELIYKIIHRMEDKDIDVKGASFEELAKEALETIQTYMSEITLNEEKAKLWDKLKTLGREDETI